MSILVGKETKLLVQGIGNFGRFHADRSVAYGTNVVGAVHPSRAGQTEVFEGETDHSGVPGREDSGLRGAGRTSISTAPPDATRARSPSVSSTRAPRRKVS